MVWRNWFVFDHDERSVEFWLGNNSSLCDIGEEVYGELWEGRIG